MAGKNLRITNKEMDEKRAKELCIWCDKKYTPSHKCKKKQAFVMQLVEEDDDEELGINGEVGETFTHMQLSP